MKIENVTGDDLPSTSTHGFKILDDEDEVLMFFHWHEDGGVEVPVVDRVINSESIMGTTRHMRTSYAEVLKVLPDRLAAFGLEKETNAIMGEVVGMFGAK